MIWRQLVINKELSPEQVNAIRGGLESGLDEEQLELIINKNLTPEKMQSIIRFAALQNSLKAERGGVNEFGIMIIRSDEAYGRGRCRFRNGR